VGGGTAAIYIIRAQLELFERIVVFIFAPSCSRLVENARNSFTARRKRIHWVLGYNSSDMPIPSWRRIWVAIEAWF
jgi:hypothetical protein